MKISTTKFKSILSILILIGFTFITQAQVGINTTDPKAMLDISIDDPNNPTITDGLLIPRVENFPSISPGANQNGMFVFLTTTVGSNTSGLYYWNNSSTSWIKILSITDDIFDTIQDADNDTKVQVEENTDEDIIRFDVGGTEYFRMNGGRLEVVNTGNSLFLGEGAGASDNLSNNRNILMGFNAGNANTNGEVNVAIGFRALASSVTASGNTAIGFWSMVDRISGNANTSLGAYSLRNNETGVANVALGFSSLADNISGDFNTAVGYNAGTNNTGSRNIFIGSDAGANAVGSDELYIENSDSSTPLIYGEFDNDWIKINGNISATNGFTDDDNDTKVQVEENTDEDIIRFDVGGTEYFRMEQGRLQVSNTNDNVFYGNDAGELTNTGFRNVVFGIGGMRNLTTGNQNVSIGDRALLSFQSGDYNIGIGSRTMNNATSGNYNIALGRDTNFEGTSGDNNIMIGSYAGYSLDGHNNVLLGNDAGFSIAGDANIMLGFNAGRFETGSNKLYIENTNSTSPLIYGEFDTDLLRVNGTLDINNAYSFPTIDGTNGQILTTNGAGIVSWQTPSFSAILENGTQTITAGTGIVTQTITFSNTYATAPQVNITIHSGDATALYVANITNVTTTTATIVVYRVDNNGGAFNGDIEIEWITL